MPMHTWRECIPVLGNDPGDSTNRKIRRIILALSDSDRVKLHQANCERRTTPAHIAVLHKVRQQFGKAGIGDVPADGGGMIVLCINTDLAKAVPSNALGPGIQSPVSVDHSLATCDRCQADVWIGPRSQAMVLANQAIRVCYKCALQDNELRDALDHAPMLSLDPNADDRPRRL